MKNSTKTPISFSEKYRPPIHRAVVWIAILALLSALALDMGECLGVFLGSLGVYITLFLTIVLRRPDAPSSTDLLLIAWGLPVLFSVGFWLYPSVLRMCGV